MCIIKNKKFENLNSHQQKLEQILIKFVEKNLIKYKETGYISTISYGEVSNEIYGNTQGGRSLGRSAGYVSVYWLRNDRPPLSVILCKKNTELPNKGFDEMYNDFYRKQKEKKINKPKRELQIKELQKDLYEYFRRIQ